jgi:hypothetical protein
MARAFHYRSLAVAAGILRPLDGELGRGRFMAILLMPFLIISIVPLLFAIVGRFATGWLAFVSCLNALLACGDM